MSKKLLHNKSRLGTQTTVIKLNFNEQNNVDKYTEFCEKFGIKFSDKNLIHQVCTHKSVRSKTAPTNERLDFLGQKVISLYAAEYLFNQVKPSELHERVYLYTKRSVNIGRIGVKMGLNKLLNWTPSNESKIIEAEKNGQSLQGLGEESVTGRVLQALVGAIYHDQVILFSFKLFSPKSKNYISTFKGAYAAKQFVHKHILSASIDLSSTSL
ncbi:8950_t:CDS:2 [Scutellospora calospora]|uniref:8950_t:CDS:1 n=1 Tax=Scutellospora calospora TaxID=85575 RepID=A0ACA9LW36_9GLOM|nr:8950_t:CDS:2 [Scutellospora calospora]